MKQVEQALARQPTIRYGPRVIEPDVLFDDNLRPKSVIHDTHSLQHYICAAPGR